MKLPETLICQANIMLDPEITPRDYIEGLGPENLIRNVVGYVENVVPRLEPGQSIEVLRTDNPQVPYRLIFRTKMSDYDVVPGASEETS